MFIDTHSHLDLDDYRDDRAAVRQRARAAGIEHTVVIGLGAEGSRRAVALAAGDPELSATCGLHPHDAERADDALWDQMRTHAARGEVAAFGEMGLDYYRDYAPRPAQRAAFARQLALAAECGLPVVLHVRAAEDEVLAMLADAPRPTFPDQPPGLPEAFGYGLRAADQAGSSPTPGSSPGQALKPEAGSLKPLRPRGVWHCFAGTANQAQRAVRMGFLISFAGQLTYPKNDALRAAARAIALDHCVLETDCPWLAPQPVRGRRNESAYLPHTAAALAALHGLAVEDVARVTTANARRLFALPGAHPRGPALTTQPVLTYRIRDALYVNLTYRCNAACVFCPREEAPFVKGYDLALPVEAEADAPTLRAEIGRELAARPAAEIVFCGFGEPTLRLPELIAVGRALRAEGRRVRLNTNGWGSWEHGRDIVPELVGALDVVSVSLNTHDPVQYEKMMRAHRGPGGWAALNDFVRRAVALLPEVHVTALDGFPGVDLEACAALARAWGATFRGRTYDALG